ncbi:DUF881 domain-containing protein [Actinoplanes palleronii]|uniref:Membrane protein n=1 Tax=Actinoplanes palleronii TaxID=113570 RepID=A0ABQ4BDF4_9ACTN|nr:DUF881 domain-containing protein [Actinoplanes palleronii]GIE68411.1 membrane protein [Actinoplanes palleronii]
MTDRDDNGRDQTTPGFGLPTAGRQPPAAEGAAPSGPAVEEETAYPVPPGGAVEEATAHLVPEEKPADPVADVDLAPEPTVELLARSTRESEPVAEEISPTSPDSPMSDTPEPATRESDLDRGAVPAAPEVADKRAGLKRPAPAGTLIWVLLALFGFTLVVQLRSNDADSGLSTMRQEDLVQILSDLEARDSRLNSDIEALERSRQQLTSGVAGREAALEEANKRSQELGLLAGTIAGRGPGLEIVLAKVKASDVLNTVQELRGSGGEVMQIGGAEGTAVRIVASTYFVDAAGGGIIADGERLTGPFRILVVGSPDTMRPALQIPGGVVASVKSDGGSVTMDSRSMVEVTAVRKATALQYARPVS